MNRFSEKDWNIFCSKTAGWPLKERLDNGMLPLVAAVDLSYLSVKEQETVSELAEQGKIGLDAI